jgi:glutathione S-transferase
MRLYHAPASPFVRKVVILLHEAGAADRVTLVPAAGNPLEPGTIPVDRNPLGKIPALVLDGGQTLYDSRVICRYLDHTLQAGLYPEPPRLWQTLVLEATADGMSDAAVLMRYEEHVRPKPSQSADWLVGQSAKIDRALAAIEGQWIGHLAGPVDIGQIALGAALGYLDYRQPQRDWRSGRPGLAAWWADFAARPALQATRPG